MASVHSPSKTETMVAASKIITMTSRNCPRNIRTGLNLGASASSFFRPVADGFASCWVNPCIMERLLSVEMTFCYQHMQQPAAFMSKKRLTDAGNSAIIESTRLSIQDYKGEELKIMRNTTSYESPFCTRYASEEMQHVFLLTRNFLLGESSGSLWLRQKWNSVCRSHLLR